MDLRFCGPIQGTAISTIRLPILTKPKHPFLVGLLFGPLVYLTDVIDISPRPLDFLFGLTLALPFLYISLVSVIGYKDRAASLNATETTGEVLIAVAKNAVSWILGGLASGAAIGVLIHAVT